MRTRSEINSTEWFGHIPNGWEMKPLKSLFSVKKGITVTKADLIDLGRRLSITDRFIRNSMMEPLFIGS